MQRHVKNFLKHYGYTTADFIPCIVCGQRAVDIHHIEPRSHWGSKNSAECDNYTNLVAPCRIHHDEAHGPNSRAIKERFKTQKAETHLADFKTRIKTLKK